MKLSAILSCVAAQYNPGTFTPQAPVAPAGGLFGGSGGMSSILPLLLLGDGLGGSDDLLPLLLLGGGLGGGAGGAGDMSSILPLLLLGDDEISVTKMNDICDDVEDASKKTTCQNEAASATTTYNTCVTAATKTKDECEKDRQSTFKDLKKTHGKENKLTDLLLLTSLAGPGGMGGAGGMSSILPLLLLGDGLGSGSSSSSDLLPLLLLSGGLGGGAVDPVTGQAAGGMDPLMMMLLLD